MSAVVETQTLLFQQLHSSICLLRILTERPANLDDFVLDPAATSPNETTSDNADSGEEDPGEDLEDLESRDTESTEDRNPKALRNRVLDRLAEILARFKSDRTTSKGPTRDAKHVSSTIMIVDEDHNMVKIFCAKNEGLVQDNTTDDTDFLDFWKACKERMSRNGKLVSSYHCRMAIR